MCRALALAPFVDRGLRFVVDRTALTSAVQVRSHMLSLTTRCRMTSGIVHMRCLAKQRVDLKVLMSSLQPRCLRKTLATLLDRAHLTPAPHRRTPMQDTHKRSACPQVLACICAASLALAALLGGLMVGSCM